MYKNFYGFRERPFSLTPDPKYLFMSQVHREAFSHLLYGIKEKQGFIQIVGEVGTGKTTLCRSILKELELMGEKVKSAIIFNPVLSSEELLKSILDDFGVQYTARTKKELIDTLNKFLLECLAHNENVILIIDEAQTIPEALLEDIRLLSNLETEKEKLLQIILMGQPELEKKLNHPQLRQLKQRIGVKYTLAPLSKPETREYVNFRMIQAGKNHSVVFAEAAYSLIYKYSKGIPRLINILCDHALLAGYAQTTRKITANLINKAYSEMEPRKKLIKTDEQKTQARRLAALITLLITTVVAAMSTTLVQESPPWGKTKTTQTEAKKAVAPIEKTPKSTPSQPASAAQNTKYTLMTPALMPSFDTITLDLRYDTTEAVFNLFYVNSQEDVQEDVVSHLLLLAKTSEVGTPVNREEQKENKEKKSFSDSIVLSKTGRQTMLASLKTLFNLWDKSLLQKMDWQRIRSSLPEADNILQHYDFHLTHAKTSLKALELYDYPCIVKLHRKNLRRYYYVAVLGIMDDYLILGDPKVGEIHVSKADFSSRWLGDAYILWKNHLSLKLPLKPGLNNNQVKQVQAMLKDIGIFKAKAGGFFGQYTKGAVKSFQRRNFLKADAIIGPETAMALYKNTEKFATPSLKNLSENHTKIQDE